MASLTELERERDKIWKKCQELKESLKNPPQDYSSFTLLAQEANDAWLEYKQKDTAFTNQLVLKQMGDLYGC